MPTRIRILGTHRYIPTPEVYQDTMTALYGSDIDSEELTQIEQQMAEHFDGLHLIEIEVEPKCGEVSWCEITQPVVGMDCSSWQAPYDERALDPGERRWVFFFHFLDTNRPLWTQCGELALPAVTPLPPHLQDIEYFAP